MFNKAFRDAMQNKAQEMGNKLADVFFMLKNHQVLILLCLR